MQTTLYLIRHGATEANLAHPPRLQGRRHNPPLAKLGILQAEATRDELAAVTLHACYCSPLERAVQTAAIIAAPHSILSKNVEALTECDLGEWEGKTWQEVRYFHAALYRDFMADPAANGYPGGESFQQVHERTTGVFDEIISRHLGQNVLIVAHHIVNRIYLASLIGLAPGKARQVSLDNCGISVITFRNGHAEVTTMNDIRHLPKSAA
jgi:broad specificity phosphatase PhoE